MSIRIYISASASDLSFVTKLEQQLEKATFDVIRPSDPELKHDCISKADQFLFVISQASLNDANCIHETEYAFRKEKPIIPVFFGGESTPLFDLMKVTLPDIQQLNAINRENFDDDDDFFKELFVVLRGDFLMMNEVFISYSRRHKPPVILIDNFLRNNGIETWVDWEDIPAAENYKLVIKEGIKNAHTFIYTISPESLASIECHTEIEEALHYNLRIIPILIKKVDSIPDEIKDLEIIDFTDENKQEQLLERILETVKTDLSYYRTYAQLNRQAECWKQQGNDENLLIKRSELFEVKKFLKESRKHKIKPSRKAHEFIKHSERILENEIDLIYCGYLYKAEKTKKVEERIDFLEKAIDTFPFRMDAWKELSQEYLQLGQYDKAIENAKKGLDYDDNIECMLVLATANLIQDDLKRSIKAFKRCIEWMETDEDLQLIEAEIAKAGNYTMENNELDEIRSLLNTRKTEIQTSTIK